MNQVPIKLGPLALLLTVISICLTTLAVLTFSSSQADLSLAEKQAQTVKTRYELESRGQCYLDDVIQAVEAGDLSEIQGDFDGTMESDGGMMSENVREITKTFSEGEMTLTIMLTLEDGAVNVTSWRIQKGWEAKDVSLENLWPGLG